jgi:hypothetical protein
MKMTRTIKSVSNQFFLQKKLSVDEAHYAILEPCLPDKQAQSNGAHRGFESSTTNKIE